MAQNIVLVANRDGEYRVRASVAGLALDLVVDTGFTHAQCRVRVGLDVNNFGAVRARLSDLGRSEIETFGISALVSSGTGDVQLEGLPASTVTTRILDAGDNVLGVCYFHRLPNHRLEWDFERRTMTISERG